MTDDSLSIGAVVETLRESHPDVSISKIRYLESRGLIRPERSARGTRRFTTDEVARLREILRLQQDEYLPLDVIARRMELWDPVETGDSDEGPMTSVQLAERTGLRVEDVESLTAHGLLRRDAGLYGPASLEIARGAAELLAEGLEPRHLRLLRSGLEQITERVSARTQAVAQGRKGAAARQALTNRLEHAVRLIQGAIADEEFERLRSD